MWLALRRAWRALVTIGLTHVLAVIVGMAMVHAGNGFALRFGDRLVGEATASSPILQAMQRGSRTKAALLDFAGNLLVGAVPQTVSGLAVFPPYGFAAFRGWVGGVVSVDGNHRSRLADAHERLYYLTVLVLQLIPYTLSGGAGVHLGVSWYREWRRTGSSKGWRLPLPKAAVVDALWLYALTVPLFLVASFIEFLAR
jgi:hypothetical protein